MSLFYIDNSKPKDSLMKALSATELGELRHPDLVSVVEAETPKMGGTPDFLPTMFLQLVTGSHFELARRYLQRAPTRLPRLWWWVPTSLLKYCFRGLFRKQPKALGEGHRER